MTIKPITPAEAGAAKTVSLPQEVIAAFNEVIAKYWNGYDATFTQTEIVALISARLGMSREKVFASSWLDVEPVYEAAGWHVEYDKPAYNETYDATFRFTKKGRR